MTIEESDFKLVQIKESSVLWDLYLLKTIRPKGCSERQELTVDSYGISLDLAVRKIAAFRLHNKHQEEAITMKVYLREYKKLVEDICNICKSLPIDPAIDESNP